MIAWTVYSSPVQVLYIVRAVDISEVAETKVVGRGGIETVGVVAVGEAEA